MNVTTSQPPATTAETTSLERKERLVRYAHQLGFDSCRIARVCSSSPHRPIPRLAQRWRAWPDGLHGARRGEASRSAKNFARREIDHRIGAELFSGCRGGRIARTQKSGDGRHYSNKWKDRALRLGRRLPRRDRLEVEENRRISCMNLAVNRNVTSIPGRSWNAITQQKPGLVGTARARC